MLPELAADRAHVADLEAKILDPERSLSALRLEKTLVQERLDAYQYPVLTLPNEITSEIFIHFLPVYPTCPPLSGPFSPILLTQICHKWRSIARTTPALGRAISLSSLDIPFAYPAHISDLLGRSGSSPLSIELAFYDNDHDIGPIPFEAALAHRERWEHLDLYTDHHGPDLPAIEGNFPLLRHIDVDFQDKPHCIVVSKAPLLRTVVLKKPHLSHVVLPWAQLISLTLEGLKAYECAFVLRQTPNLVDFTLMLCECHYEVSNPPSDVTLSRLETLACFDIDIGFPDASYEGYLDTIVVPSLRSLEITERFLQPSPIESLALFISKSGCELQELTITGPNSGPEASYHQAFPSIRKFCFRDDEVY